MDLGLRDKHAIVTGGSRGIGKAIARELAREGVDVAIVSRTKADLEASARELAAETNRRILPLAADVTSRDRGERGVAESALEARRTGSLTDVLTRPGFSTAGEVSGISGRGVGLDAVKTEVEAFGGSLEVRSEPQHGTEVMAEGATMRAFRPLGEAWRGVWVQRG